MTVPNPMNMPRPYWIYGHTLSYFTRNLTGYISYKGLPWLSGAGLRRLHTCLMAQPVSSTASSGIEVGFGLASRQDNLMADVHFNQKLALHG